MPRFLVPRHLSGWEALAFADELYGNKEAGSVELDFSANTFVSPLAMLLVGTAVQQCTLGRPCVARRLEHCGYLAHMGFFSLCGIDYGSDVGESRGSSTHLPISRLDLAVLREEARGAFELPQQRIEGLSRQLAVTLLQQERGRAYQVIQFSLQELLRNVLEHSEASKLFYCAQYWPEREVAEIAVLDSGIGIARSIAKNPSWTAQDDGHALALALLPGVSANPAAGKATRQDDPWENGGFGLYMTSQIAREKGEFLLASGNAAVVLTNGKQTVPRRASTGTIVGMRLCTQSDCLRQERIDQIVREGERLAETLTGRVISPTVASKILRTGTEA